MGSIFKGVYCCDQLHNLPVEIPAGYIINTAQHGVLVNIESVFIQMDGGTQHILIFSNGQAKRQIF